LREGGQGSPQAGKPVLPFDYKYHLAVKQTGARLAVPRWNAAKGGMRCAFPPYISRRIIYRAGLHRTYIGMIERAEKNITLENIAKIAVALGIKLNTLFDNMEC
jgi:transcriptional regulator with XRE-family HTH domain